MSEITNRERTKFSKSPHGWSGTTYVKIKGVMYMINTMKRSNGIITAFAQKIHRFSENNGCVVTEFSPLQDKAIELLSCKGTATEAKIKASHFEALAIADNNPDWFPEPSTYKLKPGQIIFSDFVASITNKRVIYAIDGNRVKSVELDRKIFHDDELEHIRPHAQKFGIGTYYIEGEMLPQDEMANLVAEAYQLKQKTDGNKVNVEKEKAEAERKAKAEAIQQYPHLNIVTEKYGGGKLVAPNIRIELKKHFPKVKFSVTSDHSSVTIKWEDGPSARQIREVTDKFKRGYWNGQNESYENVPTAFNQTFGAVQYIDTSRKMGEQTRELLIEWLNEAFGEGFSTPHNNTPSGVVYEIWVLNEVPKGEWEVVPVELITSEAFGDQFLIKAME